MTDSFFTWTSFGTLTGSTLIVIVVGNVLADVFGWRPKWFLLLLSILVSWGAFSLNHFVPAPPQNSSGVEERPSLATTEGSGDNASVETERSQSDEPVGQAPNGTSTATPAMPRMPRPLQVLLIGFNGCLIYSCAFGLQNSVVAPLGSRAGGSESEGKGEEADGKEDLEARSSSASAETARGVLSRILRRRWDSVL